MNLSKIVSYRRDGKPSAFSYCRSDAVDDTMKLTPALMCNGIKISVADNLVDQDIDISLLTEYTVVEICRKTNEWIYFLTSNDTVFALNYETGLPSIGTIEAFCGDLRDLCDDILTTDYTSDITTNGDYSEICCFYTIETIHGGCTLRWCFEGDTDYCTTVRFRRLGKERAFA